MSKMADLDLEIRETADSVLALGNLLRDDSEVTEACAFLLDRIDEKILLDGWMTTGPWPRVRPSKIYVAVASDRWAAGRTHAAARMGCLTAGVSPTDRMLIYQMPAGTTEAFVDANGMITYSGNAYPEERPRIIAKYLGGTIHAAKADIPDGEG